MIKRFKPAWPLLIFIATNLLIFKNFFFKGLLPIPGDILIGAYYPWLNYKWGTITGIPIKNPLPSDVISILYPWRIFGMSIFKNGHLPLWDPNLMLGTPLLANFQAALLNPLNLLFFIFSNHLAWSLEVVLQTFFISLATYVFLRNLEISKISSVIGSLSYAFCGFSIVWLSYNTIGYTLIFIPLALFCIDKLSKEGRPLYALLLGMALAVQLLSGYPQISIYTTGFSALYFGYRIFPKTEKLFLKVSLFIGGLGLSFLLAAVQLLPSLELLNFSIRSIDKTAIAGQIQFLPWSHLLTLVSPDFFGNPATGNYWSVGSYDNFAFYIPSAAFFFLILSLTTRVVFIKKYFIFFIFCLVSLVVAIETPVSQFIVQSNILGMQAAVAARILIIFDLSAIVLASITIDKILFKRNVVKRLHYFLPLIIASGLLLGLFLSATYIRYNISVSQNTLAVQAFRQDQQRIFIPIRNSVLPFAIFLTITLTLLIKKIKPKYVLLLLCLLLIADIYKSTNKYTTFIPAKYLYPDTQITSDLKQIVSFDRFDREKGELLPSNTWIPYGLKSIAGQNALYPLATSKYFSVIEGSPQSYQGRFVDLNNIASPLYQTLDVKYILALNRTKGVPTPDGKTDQKYKNFPGFKKYKQDSTVTIFENTKNLGLGWFSDSVRCLSDYNLSVKLLSDKNYSASKLTIVNCSGQNIKQTIPGSVRTIESTPGQLIFDVDTQKSNYLVVSQAYYPGWKAYVDGNLTQYYRANLALSAINIPQGRHTVKLKYAPESFYDGLKISLIAFIFWLILIVFSKIKYEKSTN